jgi:hypothetical protein
MAETLLYKRSGPSMYYGPITQNEQSVQGANIIPDNVLEEKDYFC